MREGTQSLTHRTLSGILWTAWGRVAQITLQTIVLAVLARLLTPADFGVVSAALVVIGFSTIVSQIGLGPALVQRKELEQRHIDSAFVASVALGTLLGATVWIIAPLASVFFHVPSIEPVLRVLAWSFVIQGLGLVSESLLRREMRFKWLANRDVVTYAVGYGAVGIALAMLGWGVWALVVAQLCQVALRTVLLLATHPPRLRRLGDWAAFKDLMYFGGGFTMAKLANYTALHGDNLVVGRMLGVAALGFYGRAYQLMTAPAHAIGLVLDNVLFPAMAKVQDDQRRLTLAFRRGVSLIALLVLPTSVIMLVVAPEIVHLLLGARWASTIAPFQVLAAGTLFRTSYKMSDSLARSTGAVYRRAWRQACYALLVLGGAWIGQHWGITGVAWGVLGAVTVNFLAMAQLSLSLTGMRWADFWGAHVPAALLTLASCPAAWATTRMARYWELPSLVTLVVVGGVAGALALVAASRYPAIFLGEDGMWILDRLRGFLPARLSVHARFTARA